MEADRSVASRVPCELVWHGAMSQRHVRAFNRLNSQQAQLIEIQLISEQSRRSAPFPALGHRTVGGITLIEASGRDEPIPAPRLQTIKQKLSMEVPWTKVVYHGDSQ